MKNKFMRSFSFDIQYWNWKANTWKTLPRNFLRRRRQAYTCTLTMATQYRFDKNLINLIHDYDTDSVAVFPFDTVVPFSMVSRDNEEFFAGISAEKFGGNGINRILSCIFCSSEIANAWVYKSHLCEAVNTIVIEEHALYLKGLQETLPRYHNDKLFKCLKKYYMPLMKRCQVKYSTTDVRLVVTYLG